MSKPDHSLPGAIGRYSGLGRQGTHHKQALIAGEPTAAGSATYRLAGWPRRQEAPTLFD